MQYGNIDDIMATAVTNDTRPLHWSDRINFVYIMHTILRKSATLIYNAISTALYPLQAMVPQAQGSFIMTVPSTSISILQHQIITRWWWLCIVILFPLLANSWKMAHSNTSTGQLTQPSHTRFASIFILELTTLTPQQTLFMWCVLANCVTMSVRTSGTVSCQPLPSVSWEHWSGPSCSEDDTDPQPLDHQSLHLCRRESVHVHAFTSVCFIPYRGCS